MLTPNCVNPATAAELIDDLSLADNPSLPIHALHPRNVVAGHEPVLHVAAGAAYVEHGLDRRKHVPPAHADEISRPTGLTFPRNQNDVARLALRALLCVL